ncbi:MAG: 16S rRNA (uracil(1498)-N(3))-methyltransferase [Bifidobacteriaceae bacterium]|jgi:16S rRNA (uracil1498-N3)-methyltransferase|nr:16S rRNA (uracil(1498)-N(3))-methyltransferase [Bifidobacteriaceae bacterium]
MTAPLLWVAPEALASARAGQTLVVEGPDAHHAVAVRRLRVGEPVLVSDAVGGLARASVAEVVTGSRARLTVVVEAVERVARPRPRLVLVQALAKQRRDERAVAAATGLGVDAIIPWQAERSVTRWDGPKAAKGVDRWRALARAEAQVARRARVPEVLAPVGTDALAEALGGEVGAGRARGIVLHEDAAGALAEALGGEVGAGRARGIGRLADVAAIYLVTGPEGGIAPGELDRLTGAGCRLARLGPEVLRAGVAGPAALAVVSHLLGRWSR